MLEPDRGPRGPPARLGPPHPTRRPGHDRPEHRRPRHRRGPDRLRRRQPGRRGPGPGACPPLAEGYEAAWRAGDPEAAAALYTPDAHYRSEPFRAPHLGREGVLTYTRDAYATEADQDPRFGAPFASGASAAVEWWTTTLEEGQPATLIGTSFLTFTPDGLVATGRDYWFLEPGFHPPHDEWGR
jgi:hypothetical protein